MENPYKEQLIKNLSVTLKGCNIVCNKYYHIDTIRLDLPAEINLIDFKNNFYNLLEKLPEIDYPREMVCFWLSQSIINADFYKLVINPSPEATRNWSMVGTGPDTWVHKSEL